jgi:hypothetical protein
MKQLDFLSPRPHARRTDPATSHDAARSIHGSAEALTARLYAVLARRGPMTRSELTAAAGQKLSDYQVSKRVSDLKNAKLIVDTGQTRPGPTGRMQTVWRAT